MNRNELKKYIIDILARVSQVIFTLLIITPFIANIFNWGTFIVEFAFFVLSVVIGAVIASSMEVIV